VNPQWGGEQNPRLPQVSLLINLRIREALLGNLKRGLHEERKKGRKRSEENKEGGGGVR